MFVPSNASASGAVPTAYGPDAAPVVTSTFVTLLRAGVRDPEACTVDRKRAGGASDGERAGRDAGCCVHFRDVVTAGVGDPDVRTVEGERLRIRT